MVYSKRRRKRWLKCQPKKRYTSNARERWLQIKQEPGYAERMQRISRHISHQVKVWRIKDRLLHGKYKKKYPRRTITSEHGRIKYLLERKDGTAGVCSIGG